MTTGLPGGTNRSYRSGNRKFAEAKVVCVLGSANKETKYRGIGYVGCCTGKAKSASVSNMIYRKHH